MAKTFVSRKYRVDFLYEFSDNRNAGTGLPVVFARRNDFPWTLLALDGRRDGDGKVPDRRRGSIDRSLDILSSHLNAKFRAYRALQEFTQHRIAPVKTFHAWPLQKHRYAHDAGRDISRADQPDQLLVDDQDIGQRTDGQKVSFVNTRPV